MLVLNIMGHDWKIGLFHLAAGVLGVFADGWIFTEGGIIGNTAYSSGFQNQTIDPNIYVVIIALMTITSFILLMRLRTVE